MENVNLTTLQNALKRARAERDRLAAENAALVAQLREVQEKASTAKHAQVFALTEERDTITAERNRLRDALHMCDVVMDTAAMHGLPQQLPPAYKESWAAVHTNAREVLKEIE